MKLYKLVIFLVSVLLCSSSCRREYECRCCGGVNGDCSYHFMIESKSEMDAHRKCRNYSTPPGTVNGYLCNLR